MINCQKCQENPAADIIGLCVDCLRSMSSKDYSYEIHKQVRENFSLPIKPPRSATGIQCNLCANHCQMAEEQTGFCGLHQNKGAHLVHRFPQNTALAYMYLDLLPTNCCASWFCKGSHKSGYNLAVFFYGCNFDCLFCQNSSHKLLSKASVVTEEEMVKAALDDRVSCVCFFGGSPEPQLPFALRVTKRIIEKSDNKKHICWEWNGCGNPKLVGKAMELTTESGGTVKFDLKSYHPHVSQALCGVDNQQAFQNFKMLANGLQYPKILTASTLLVPYYIDWEEVAGIAKFIAGIDANIHYSLLVFSPNFYMSDMPVTPKWQVAECYSAACQYLHYVHLGNKHLL